MGKHTPHYLTWFSVLVIALGSILFIVGVERYERWEPGVSGEIVAMQEEMLIVRDRGIERSILITPETDIRHGREKNEVALKSGDFIIVFGREIEGGIIEADLIRILNPFFGGN
ncbi:MAG: hypothetical protein WAV21_03730 [Minisyncoccia bacterium]